MLAPRSFSEIIDLQIVQDSSIQTDWKSRLKYEFLHGQSKNEFDRKLSHFFQELLLKMNPDLPAKTSPTLGLMFIFNGNIIKKEKTLTTGKEYIWKKVSCCNSEQTNSTVDFMMAIPKNPRHCESLSAAIYVYITGIFSKVLQFAVERSDIQFHAKNLMSNSLRFKSRYQLLLDLVYIKEIDFPYLLIPEHLGIEIELQDYISLHERNDIDYIFPLNYYPHLVDKRYFSIIKRIGNGKEGECTLLRVDKSKPLIESAQFPEKMFVSKAIKASSASSEDTLTDAPFCTPRSKLFHEVNIFCLLSALKNPYIVRPCHFKYHLNGKYLWSAPLFIFDNDGEELRLMHTMEYAEGSDFKDIDVDKLEAKTKLRIAINLAEAINTLHENGYIHNDLHMRNIRLTKTSNKPIILDLGCCEKIDKVNYFKDINFYVRAVKFLYKIDDSQSSTTGVIPMILQPFVNDALANKISKRTYKTMGDILISFSKGLDGITLERKYLDLLEYFKDKWTPLPTTSRIDREQEELGNILDRFARLPTIEKAYLEEQANQLRIQEGYIEDLVG